jgi:hypothetical protein
MRILCRIFGCASTDRYYPACDRCGTDIYHWNFIDQNRAWLNPWYTLCWWLRCNRDWFYHKCDVCKKPMAFTKKECCSEECYDLWVPF